MSLQLFHGIYDSVRTYFFSQTGVIYTVCEICIPVNMHPLIILLPGYLFDTVSPNMAFLVFGGINAFGGLLVGLIPVVVRLLVDSSVAVPQNEQPGEVIDEMYKLWQHSDRPQVGTMSPTISKKF